MFDRDNHGMNGDEWDIDEQIPSFVIKLGGSLRNPRNKSIGIDEKIMEKHRGFPSRP
jgi:hypothetical protein